jgi:hypothetical protein
MLTSLLVRGKRPLNKLIDGRNRVVPLLRKRPAIGVHPEQVNVIGRGSPFDQHLLFPNSTFFDFVTSIDRREPWTARTLPTKNV